jgi:hypothetical protein
MEYFYPSYEMNGTYRRHLGLEALIAMNDILEIGIDQKDDETYPSNTDD